VSDKYNELSNFAANRYSTEGYMPPRIPPLRGLLLPARIRRLYGELRKAAIDPPLLSRRRNWAAFVEALTDARDDRGWDELLRTFALEVFAHCYAGLNTAWPSGHLIRWLTR